MDVDETGHVVITGETLNSPEGADAIRRTETYWDVSGSGAWGTTWLSDTLPERFLDTALNYHFPRIEVQEYGGQIITHVLAMDSAGAPEADPDSRDFTYWRKSQSASGPGGTWTGLIVSDLVHSDCYDMAAARGGSGNFVIVWEPPRVPDESEDLGSHIWVMRSDNAGASFDTPFDLIDFDYETDSWQPWHEAHALFDSENYLHIVWNAQQYQATAHSANSIDPARIFHWTDRVSGTVHGGKTSLVHVADFHGLSSVCGRGQWNDMNVGRPVISECNGRLYCIWKQFGNVDTGDTLDCADPSTVPWLGGANGDIYMSISLGLDGSLWDAGRNLTPVTTPNCDTTPGNECSNYTYATMSRYGMNTADHGTTYWGAVPEAFQVRDMLDNTWPETGYYLDVMYTDDLMPEIARYLGDWFTYSPIKWFRLPCVEPVVAPDIFISQADFIHPADWVKAGQEYELEVLVENIGNDILTVSSVAMDVTQGPGTWWDFDKTTFTIGAAGTDVVTVTLNPGGTIDPAAGTAVAIEGDVIFTSDDPDTNELSFTINTVVADTVVQIQWDSIQTDLGVGLTVANNGGVGNVGIGGYNLDFVGPDTLTAIDCDVTQNVYLYDACPVIMTAVDDYSWGPFWTEATAASYNFQPIPGTAPEITETTDWTMYSSGNFVTHDSSIVLTRHWVAPKEDVSWLIEFTEVGSNTGSNISDVYIGEWLDWDIPTDTASNNEGGLAGPGGDYIWMRGLEYGEDDGCLASDLRYGASGLLGWCYASEREVDDDANNTGLYAGYVLLDNDLFATGADNTFIADSMWARMTTAGQSANNTEANDQQIVLSFGGFEVRSGDVLQIFAIHASQYNGDDLDLATMIDEAKLWYAAHRSEFAALGCCGAYTGGKPGNTDCDVQGKYNLSDITKTITRVYLDPDTPLCCEENGDVNCDTKINLTDITQLITRVYLNPSFEFCDCP